MALAPESRYSAGMASRTTLGRRAPALPETGAREGVSGSDRVRRGIRLRTATRGIALRKPPTVGWLRLSAKERAAIAADAFGDLDAGGRDDER